MYHNGSMGSGRDKRKRLAKKEAAHALESAKRKTARLMRVTSPPPDQPGTDDTDATVGVPLRPRPHLRSGAVAIPEPSEPDDEVTIKSVNHLS